MPLLQLVKFISNLLYKNLLKQSQRNMYSLSQSSHNRRYLNALANIDELQTNYSMEIDEVQAAQELIDQRMASLEQKARAIEEIQFSKQISRKTLTKNFEEMIYVVKFLNQNHHKLDSSLDKMRKGWTQILLEINQFREKKDQISTQIFKQSMVSSQQIEILTHEQSVLISQISKLQIKSKNLESLIEYYEKNFRYRQQNILNLMEQKIGSFKKYIVGKLNKSQNQGMEQLLQEFKKYIKKWFKKKQNNQLQIVLGYTCNTLDNKKVKSQQWLLNQFKQASKESLSIPNKNISPTKKKLSLSNDQKKRSVSRYSNKAKSKQKINNKSQRLRNKSIGNLNESVDEMRNQLKQIKTLLESKGIYKNHRMSQTKTKIYKNSLMDEEQDSQRPNSKSKSIYEETQNARKKKELTLKIVLSKEEAYFLTP